MTGSQLLARTVAVVTAAATLLVVPVATESSYATAEQCSTAVAQTCRTVGDTDGDGLPDTGDGCPTVASSNPTGCPTASRTASLKWLKSKNRLQTRITSPVTACSSRARIVLWRVRPNRDFKQAGVTANTGGRHRFTVPRGARYYVTVAPSYASGQAECARATSRTVLVPRG